MYLPIAIMAVSVCEAGAKTACGLTPEGWLLCQSVMNQLLDGREALTLTVISARWLNLYASRAKMERCLFYKSHSSLSDKAHRHVR